MNVNKWGSYDVKCLNAVMKIPDLAEIKISVYDDFNKVHTDEFLWEGLKRFGPHDIPGRYFHVTLAYRDFLFDLEFGGEDDVFVYKASPHKHDRDIKFYVSGVLRWGVKGTVSTGNDCIAIETANGTDRFTVLGDSDETTLINAVGPGILMNSSRPVYVRCNNNMTIPEMEEYLRVKREEAQKGQVKSGGMLKDSCEAILKSLIWNTIYEPNLKDICTVITRQWCNGYGAKVFGSYILACWDTFFAALLGGVACKELAYLQVYSILSQATKEGFIPNFGSQRGKSEDRSQPPVGAYCVYKLYKQFNDKSLLENTFDKLMAWHRWWPGNRDGNKDGLLEWGSNHYPVGELLGYGAHTLDSAKLESGLDNSPMYDKAVFNEETSTMELSDVGLNCFFALDSWALSKIAMELGYEETASDLNDEYEQMKKRINDTLWNEEKGIYLNRYWDGRFSQRMSPTCFYPMIAGIATHEQAKRMVDEHLLNTEEFWGEYVIPSTPRSEKEFNDNFYWRGRIWAPMNFLVSEGLKRYGFYDISYMLAEKSLGLFNKEWEEKGHIHENYNPVTGEGDDVVTSDPFYHWGALLLYIAVSEIIEVQAWAGIRFGNLSGQDCFVENYPIGSDYYSVYIDHGKMTIKKNGKVHIETDKPVRITNYSVENDTLHFTAAALGPANIRISLPQGIARVAVSAGTATKEYRTSDGTVAINI